MIEELEQLSRETLLSACEQASTGMANTRNRKLRWRVIDAARKVITAFWGKMDPDEALEILGKPRSLSEQCVSYEGKLIKQALMQTNGHIPDTASLLTLTPEHLTVILELRHKDLLALAAADSNTGRAVLQLSPVIG